MALELRPLLARPRGDHPALAQGKAEVEVPEPGFLRGACLGGGFEGGGGEAALGAGEECEEGGVGGVDGGAAPGDFHGFGPPGEFGERLGGAVVGFDVVLVEGHGGAAVAEDCAEVFELQVGGGAVGEEGDADWGGGGEVRDGEGLGVELEGVAGARGAEGVVALELEVERGFEGGGVVGEGGEGFELGRVELAGGGAEEGEGAEGGEEVGGGLGFEGGEGGGEGGGHVEGRGGRGGVVGDFFDGRHAGL